MLHNPTTRTSKPGIKLPNPIDKHVGSRVRMRRMMIGKSQEWLGEKFNISFQQIQKYEKGTNRIGSSRLAQIADALGVSVAWFFEGAPNAPRAVEGAAVVPDFTQAFLATSDGLALAGAFMRIKNRKLRHRIVGLVEQIAGEDDHTYGADSTSR